MLAAFHAGYYMAGIGHLRPPILPNVLRVAPTGSGDQSGSSWDNAAPIAALNSLIPIAAAAGADIWLRADAGSYPENTISLTNSGPVGGRVNIVGRNSDGTPGYATFVGTRTNPYVNGAGGGNTAGLFQLNAGANRLGFGYLKFERCGLGCIRFRQPVSDILIEDIEARNIASLILNSAGGVTSATATGVVIRRVAVRGFSKKAIYFRYDSSSILIEDAYLDSEQQIDPVPWATGIMFDGTAHAIVIRRATALNCYHNAGAGYWNGDGFTTERGNYDVLYEYCVSKGHTDAGWDLKSLSTTLFHCLGEDCKRIYRLWGEIELLFCTGLNPYKRGGSGGTHQIWSGERSFVRAVSCIFKQISTGVLFFAEKSGFLGIDTVTQANVVKPSGAPLSSLSGPDCQFVIFSATDSGVPVITSPSTADQNEETPGLFSFTATKPAIVETQAGGDRAQFSAYGKKLSSKPQNYEAPLHPDQKIHGLVKMRDANNNRSALMDFTVTILNIADDPIAPVEAFAYSGSNGSWYEALPTYLYADPAMTEQAEDGDIVWAVADRSGKGNHLIAASASSGLGQYQTDGAGRHWVNTNGFDNWGEMGSAGEFRFAQMTAIMVVDRDDDDTARRYLFSYPRSTTAGTSFNSVYSLGFLDTQTLWGRTAGNNQTSSTGGGARSRPLVCSLRSTDGIGRSNNVGYVDLPDQATLTYASSVSASKARLFCDGNPTPGGLFLGRWYGGAFFNAALDDDTRFRVERQLGQLAGVAL